MRLEFLLPSAFVPGSFFRLNVRQKKVIVKRLLSSILLLVSAASLVYSQTPTIASFAPSSGPIGSTVTINGTNFNASPSNNIVYFGGVRASVSSASSIQLSVIVPVSASYAPISVTDSVNGLTGYSLAPFVPTFVGGVALSSSSFFPKLDFTTGDLPYGVAIGDLDGDGRPDFVVTNNTDNSISVFRNTGTGDSLSSNSFAPAVNFTTGKGPWGVAIADLNGDGKLDIVVSNGNDGSISVFRNTSTSGGITANSFAHRIDFATGGGGGGGYGIAVADLDGDGKPDLIVTNRLSGNSGTISVLQNTSSVDSISFATHVDFPAGALPYGIAAGDLDGDGKIDLVVADQGTDSLSIFRNMSTIGITINSFAPRVSLATSGTPIAVAIADLNGDGKPEIISANSSDSTLTLFQNISTSGSLTSGSFMAGIDFKLNSAPNSIALGDFNGDGQPDIAAANGNSNTVSIFQNTNNFGSAISINSLGAEADFTTASLPFGLAIADLNGDGRPDLVATSSSNNAVSVFLSDVGAASITVNTIPINFGYVVQGKSSEQDLVITDNSVNTLFVDSIYANRKEISFSVTHGSSNTSLKDSLVFRADTVGLFTDTVLIKSNALTPLLKIPVFARVYTLPGRPTSCAVNPPGWSNAQTFTISWTNPQNGMLPIDKILYSIDTLPKAAAIVDSVPAAGTSASVSITQVGKDTVYFYLEDSLGNRNQDSVGSVLVKFDNNAPSITQNNSSLDTIFVEGDTTLSSIPPIVSSAADTATVNESGLMALTLLYRRLDGQLWDTLNFPSFTGASLTLPQTSFVKNGIVVGAEYRIQAIDSAGNSTLSNLFSFDVRYESDLAVTDFSNIPSIHSLNLPAGQHRAP